jgi:beta-glucanase (GH16 family)
MSLIRKKTLNQLINIDKIDGDNIGDITTKDLDQNHIYKKDNDIEYDDAYNLSNIAIGDYGLGNFGEFFGDITNDNKNANLMFIHNPLKMEYVPNYEDYSNMFGFGDFWSKKDMKKNNKIDKELTESKSYKNILSFKDFIK